MNITYISACIGGIVLLLISLYFTILYGSKLFDYDVVVLEGRNLNSYGTIYFRMSLVGWAFAGIALLTLWFEILLGMPHTSQQNGVKAIILPFTVGMAIPFLVFCILSPLKTRRLAAQGNKVAGYLSSKINPRFNLFRLQVVGLVVSITSLFLIIVELPTLDPHYIIKQNTAEGRVYCYFLPHIVYL
jgi:hypothetical protein